MRNYNRLWGLWALWALLVIVWLIDINMALPPLLYGKALAVFLGFSLPALIIFFYKTKRNRLMFLLNKNKKTPENRLNTNEIKNSPELIDSVSPVRVKKDTFISQGAQIIGNVETAGNILVEGDVSGDMFCGNSIKVEHIGKVNGEIKAQQIIIDGYVEGRIEAKAVSILAQGKMVGDIFSDEFSIEKGGVFIGQSHPLPQDQERIVYAQGRGSVDSDEVDAGGAAE